jgi:hypothetical protein
VSLRPVLERLGARYRPVREARASGRPLWLALAALIVGVIVIAGSC